MFVIKIVLIKTTCMGSSKKNVHTLGEREGVSNTAGKSGRGKGIPVVDILFREAFLREEKDLQVILLSSPL